VNLRTLEVHLAGARDLDPAALDLDVAARLEDTLGKMTYSVCR
jgi:hypothetical protein